MICSIPVDPHQQRIVSWDSGGIGWCYFSGREEMISLGKIKHLVESASTTNGEVFRV
jgi:hypothetical protein